MAEIDESDRTVPMDRGELDRVLAEGGTYNYLQALDIATASLDPEVSMAVVPGVLRLRELPGVYTIDHLRTGEMSTVVVNLLPGGLSHNPDEQLKVLSPAIIQTVGVLSSLPNEEKKANLAFNATTLTVAAEAPDIYDAMAQIKADLPNLFPEGVVADQVSEVFVVMNAASKDDLITYNQIVGVLNYLTGRSEVLPAPNFRALYETRLKNLRKPGAE